MAMNESSAGGGAFSIDGDPANARSPKILIIDDDPTMVFLMDTMLRHEGFRTLTASNGPAGRILAAQEKPDMILMDVVMPEESGLDTCRILKSIGSALDTPILFLSANDDVGAKVAGLEAGAVDYITKPFVRAEVMARVRTHLRLKKAYESHMELQSQKLSLLAAAQKGILVSPKDYPKERFAVYYQALQEAGGDFYDVIPIHDYMCDYIVADISGHDLGTSLITAALKALLHQNSSPVYTPVEIVHILNRVIPSILQPGQYITLVYARLNRRNKQLTVVCAGHPPALIQAKGHSASALLQTGDVIGGFDNASFGLLNIPVVAGDRIFLYSDGLIEIGGQSQQARNKGIEKLARQCDFRATCGLAVAVDETAAHLFLNSKPEDDLVLLGVEV
jgi:sigma-B regulation protein RsbU (phosphoserine phosphatase)